MHSKTKKLLAAFCMGAMVLTPVPTVAAAEPIAQQENGIMPYMTYIQRAKCDFNIVGTTANVECSVTGRSPATKAKVIAELQVKNGNSWIPVEIWTDTQDSYEAYVDESHAVTKGHTYRVKATVTIWEGSQSETQYLYSSEKTA